MKYSLTFLLLVVLAMAPALRADEPDLLQAFVDELVPITPGEGKFPKSFEMGSEIPGARAKPVHEVTFGYSFAIAKYEVPQNLYERVMDENPSRWQGPRNSVEMMTRAEAVEFCEKLTALLRERKLIGEEEVIRLPTEAEWEYCCRAGTTTRYSFGDDAREPGDDGNLATVLDDFAWHAGNAAGNDPPVGALKPNPWGLYDMHGYLREYVLDDWYPDYQEAPSDGSPRIIPESERIVLRGGSWKDRYDQLTSSYRQSAEVGIEDDAVGFRCVKSTPLLERPTTP